MVRRDPRPYHPVDTGRGTEMHEADNSPSEGDADRVIANLSHQPLDVVLRPEHSALDNAVRRVLADIVRLGENYAAHGTTP